MYVDKLKKLKEKQKINDEVKEKLEDKIRQKEEKKKQREAEKMASESEEDEGMEDEQLQDEFGDDNDEIMTKKSSKTTKRPKILTTILKTKKTSRAALTIPNFYRQIRLQMNSKTAIKARIKN